MIAKNTEELAKAPRVTRNIKLNAAGDVAPLTKVQVYQASYIDKSGNQVMATPSRTFHTL
jgi:hypothetical protein